MYPSNLQSEREKSAKDMAATDDPDSSGESSPSNQVPVGAKRKSTGIPCSFFFPQLYWVLLLKIQHKFIIQHKRKEKKKQTPKRSRCNGTNVPCEAPPLD